MNDQSLSRKFVTRFAPSPTGRLHVGNARTALFNWLLARHGGGELILRVEDTDRARSVGEHESGQMADLRWLGIEWQAGPDIGGAHAPYRQSERQSIYDGYFRQLESSGKVYACFCSPQELKLARKTQLAAGRPPRYSGRCAKLDAAEAARRLAAGEAATLRFRVPADEVVEFDDLVFGPQTFRGEDIGDFVIRRADGTPAFFFSNAVDDALMGVTHAFRGEDHLANTPRQLMLLHALGMKPPRYGHFPLVKDSDGGPLSKRLGSLGLHQLREQGYLPLALANHLARLGHSFAVEKFRNMEELAADFDVNRFGRAPAKYDPAQLLHWQKESMLRLTDAEFEEWLLAHAGPALAGLEPDTLHAFALTVRDNVVLPTDASRMFEKLLGTGIEEDFQVTEVVRSAGTEFFRDAAALVGGSGGFGEFSKAVGTKTGRKGRELFMPLRAALSGEMHGPEMARIWTLLGNEKIRARLMRAAELASK
ncbi:MAG TPA: glutamate--tRNA ligase [Gammaproteobacteria bacterium]